MMCGLIRQPETPTRTARKLYDILVDIGISGSDTTLQIQVNNEILATNAMVLGLWLQYGEYIYSQSNLQHYYKEEAGQTVEVIGGCIVQEWADFITRNGYNLKRLADAFKMEYNPVENYAMLEQGADGEKEDKTTNTPHGTISNTQYTAGVKTTGDGAISGKNETTYTNAKTETTHDSTQSMTFDGDTLSGYFKTHEHYFKRSGNIGVSTAADMLTGEQILRQYNDIIARFVKDFINQYCYFVG